MALPQQFKPARMTDATVANTIDTEHGALEQAIADVLGFPIDTDIATAAFLGDATGLRVAKFQPYTVATLPATCTVGEIATVSDGIGTVYECHATDTWRPVTIPTYTVATLPAACTEFQKAIITDGGAAGSTVQCDDSNTWRCADEYTKHEINPYCPPYNADRTATDGTNHTAMQAVLDRAKDWTVNNKQRYWGINMGCDVLEINNNLEYDPNPDTSTLLHIYSHCEGGLKFTGASGVGTYGLKFAGAAGNGNILHLDRLEITGAGGTSGPETAVWLNNQVQVWITNNRIGGGTKYDLRLSGNSGHTLVQGNIFGEGAIGDAGGAYIKLEGTHSELIIDANMSEGSVENLLSDFLQAADNYTTSAFRFTNNAHRGNSIQSLIDFNFNDVQIASGVIAHNTGIQLEGIAIDLGGTNNSLFDTVIVSDNALEGDSTKTNTCMRFFDLTNVTVADNQCKGFDKGFDINGTITRSSFRNNSFQDTDTTCVEWATGASSYVDIDGVECDGGATADVATSGTSLGNNRIANVVATDGSVPIIDTTGLNHATDMLELANRVQEETCGATLNLTPVYANIQLAVTASPCVITLIEPSANGAAAELLVVSTSGTTADIADDGSIANLSAAWAGGVGDVLNIKYNAALGYWYETGRSDN